MTREKAARIRFQRLGRSHHLVIETAEHLEQALDLDEARWMATLAPIASFHADPVLLSCLDGDGDEFIKVRDFKKAIRWTLERLRDRTPLNRRSDILDPACLDPEDPVSKKILLALKRFEICHQDREVNLADVRAVMRDMEKQAVSGVGVVLSRGSQDERVSDFIARLIQVGGGVPHPSGEQGLSEALLDGFLRDGRALLDWRLRRGSEEAELSPLGDATAAAYEVLQAVAPRLERYFALCDMMAIDPDGVPRIWPFGAHLQGEDLDDAAAIRASLERAPVAEPRADGELRWDAPLNPAARAELEALRRQVVQPLLGESASLSAPSWRALQGRFAAYGAWLAARPESPWDCLSDGELQELLTSDAVDAVRGLIAQSRRNAFDLDNLRLAEKLALYQRDLLEMANNFISFPRLYTPGVHALFEEGTLVVDGRRFTFAMRVHDRKEHVQVTEQGSMFVAYAEIFHQRTNRRYEVAVPVTAGTQGLLNVGKRGVFEHVDGTEWTARVVHIVDRPISLWEAICAPFVRLGQAVTRKVETITSEAEKKLEQVGGNTVGQLQQAPAAPQSSTGNMLAGGGIAVAAVGSSLAFITKTLATLKWWQVLYGLGGAVAAVLAPSLVIAMIRLRRRDMSCILEGSRWGINARMRLTHAQRHTFTQRPGLPAGSHVELDLPGLRRRWRLVVLSLVALALAIVAILVNT